MAVVTRQQLISLINQYIYSNGNQRITGDQLNEILLEIANAFQMQGGSAGIDGVLAAGSVVSDGREITNELGGKLRLSASQEFEGELRKFMGFNIASSPYQGFLYTSDGLSVIGNQKKMPDSVAAMTAMPEPDEEFNARTIYNVKDGPVSETLDKDDDSLDRGIISTVSSSNYKTTQTIYDSGISANVRNQFDENESTELSAWSGSINMSVYSSNGSSSASVNNGSINSYLSNNSGNYSSGYQFPERFQHSVQENSGLRNTQINQYTNSIQGYVFESGQYSQINQYGGSINNTVTGYGYNSQSNQSTTQILHSVSNGPQTSFHVQTPIAQSWSNETGEIVVIDHKGLKISTGKKMTLVAGGAAQTAGRVSLFGGTASVFTTAISANSVVNLTVQVGGTFTGNIRVSALNPGSSFTILSSVNTDNCTVFWQIIDL